MEWIKYQRKCPRCCGCGEELRPMLSLRQRRHCPVCDGKGYIEIELRKVSDATEGKRDDGISDDPCD